jgi:O-methyltransferase
VNLSGWVKGTAVRLARKTGYEIRRRPRDPNVGGPLYGPVNLETTYSPWNGDEAFVAAYRAIVNHTLVDIYRCYELWSLVEQSHKLTGSIIEVGVWRGGTGTLLAERASTCGISDTVYLCDTFTGVVKASERDSTYRGGEHADSSRSTVERLLSSRKLSNARILEGIFPEETGCFLESATFRLCHIDVDVYRSARDAAEWLWPRLVVGGVIVYDDYGSQGCSGITQHVDEQISFHDRLVLHNLNGHAVVVKIR